MEIRLGNTFCSFLLYQEKRIYANILLKAFLLEGKIFSNNFHKRKLGNERNKSKNIPKAEVVVGH
jgi:hypothetical protein